MYLTIGHSRLSNSYGDICLSQFNINMPSCIYLTPLPTCLQSTLYMPGSCSLNKYKTVHWLRHLHSPTPTPPPLLTPLQLPGRHHYEGRVNNSSRGPFQGNYSWMFELGALEGYSRVSQGESRLELLSKGKSYEDGRQVVIIITHESPNQ